MYLRRYFVLTREEEMLHKMNSTVFNSLLTMCTFYPHSSHLVNKEGWKGKGTMDSLFFSFCAIICSWTGWLTQESNTTRKECVRFPWLFFFLKCLCFLFVCKPWLKRKSWPRGGCRCPLHIHRLHRLTLYLLWVSLNPTTPSGTIVILTAHYKCNMQM